MTALPRVTQILRPFTSYDKVPHDVLKRAAERGTDVHEVCAGLAKGAWVPDGMIRDDIRGYIDSFNKWRAAQVQRFTVVEERFEHPDHRFSGQIDMVFEDKAGLLYLADLKTSVKPQKTYPVQMAAYDMLLRHHGYCVHSAMLVYLSKDGDFPDIEVIEDLNEQKLVFLSALDCWYYFNKELPDDRPKPQ